MNKAFIGMLFLFVCVLLLGGLIGRDIYEPKFLKCQNETYEISKQLIEAEKYAMEYAIRDQTFRVKVYECERDFDTCFIGHNNEDILVLVGNNINESQLIWIDI